MKRICHISTVHSVFDTRIFYKECKTLVKAGYEVYLIITHNREEVVEGVHIIPFPERKGRFYRFFVKDWLALFKAIKVNARVYHFHDPELILTGLILKLFGKKVVYDVHEDVFHQINDKVWIRPIFKFLAKKQYKFFELLAAKVFDEIILAEDGYLSHFKSNYNFAMDKILILRNFPIISLIDSIKSVEDITKANSVIIYAGGLTRIRGIKELIEAAGILEGKAELWLLGSWESKEFEKECRSLEGWQYTKYLGFKKLEEVYKYMKRSDIGIATLYPIKNYLNSLPVKVFEYMSCGLPIVMSNFPYWKKIFKNCAIFVDPQNPKDIAERVNILLENRDLWAKFGKANRDLVENKYSWEAESKKLINLYKELLK